MKIDSLNIYVTECKVRNPFAYSRAWVRHREAVLVEITTDTGVVGWGEAFGPGSMSAGALRLLKPFLIGSDPLNNEKIWHDMYGRFREHGRKGPLMDAMSAIDIALWDIKGKVFKMPIHRLLGGPIREHVPAYASALFRRESGSADQYLPEEAQSYVKDGFRTLKLKVGFGLREDARAVEAIREAVGSETQLMVDANGAYDAGSAIRLGRQLERFDISWFEEPVPPDDLAGYVDTRRSQPIPIAGGEAEFTRFGFRELFIRHAVDVAQPDICAAGGFTECKKIVDMATAFGIEVCPHTWGTPISIAASLQLLAVVPDNPPSLFPCPPMLEYDLTEHGIRDAMMVDNLRPHRGSIEIPSGPGLGIEIDRNIVRQFLVK